MTVKYETKPKPLFPLLVACLFVACWAVWVCDREPVEACVWRSGPGPQYFVGLLHYRGVGMPASSAEAARWFTRAAARGHAKAQNALGLLYVRGDGVARDYQKARVLFRKAAEQGVVSAQNQLGMLYAQGKGMPQDLDLAASWFAKAAGQGFAPATLNLKLLASLHPSFMPTLTLRSGKTYCAVHIQKVEPDSMTVAFHPNQGGVGIAKLSFRDLPSELQNRYGYVLSTAARVATADQLSAVTLGIL